MKSLLTQQELVSTLREELGVHAGTRRIHGWIRAGMPTIPGGKKPRFSWAAVRAWLIGVQEQDPLTLEVRDRMLAQRYRGAS